MRIALVACAFACLGAQRVAAQGAITGRVCDLDGHAIAGARVFVCDPIDHERITLETKSGDAGRFALSPLEVLPYVEVFAEAEGFARLGVTRVSTHARKPTDLGDLVLEPGAVVRGRVVDASGAGIADACVRVQTLRHLTAGCCAELGPHCEVRTSSDGRFATPALGPGTQELCVYATGSVRVEQRISLAPGSERRELDAITLSPDVPIAGIVVAPNGAPVPGAKIFGDYDYDNEVTSDEHGRFVLRGHGADAKRLQARASSFIQCFLDLPADHASVRVAMRVAKEIRGRVIDAETGEPVPIEEVTLCTVERRAGGAYDLYG